MPAEAIHQAGQLTAAKRSAQIGFGGAPHPAIFVRRAGVGQFFGQLGVT
jgi:hypothetical protein